MNTQADFEQAYAERSGVTVESLHVWGRSAFPCDCGEEICEGWQMVNAADHIEGLILRGLPIPRGSYHLNREVDLA